MPRTLIAQEKTTHNGQLINPGQTITTDKFDGAKLPKVWKDLVAAPEAVGADVAPVDDLPGVDDGDGLFSESDLEAKTAKELTAIAKEMRVDNYSSMNKAATIIAIMSMQESNEILQDTTTANGTGLATPVVSGADVTPV